MDQNEKTLLALNSFNEQDLVEIFHCSPRLAKRIIALRPFSSLEALDQIWGIDDEIKQNILQYSGEIEQQSLKPQFTEKKVQTIVNDSASTLSDEKSTSPMKQPKTRSKPSWKSISLLVVIFVFAAIFRFSGINWDNGLHQHPDERYMTMVAEQIRGVSSIKEYFNTYESTLNPLNHGSYTYGMLPLFVTRLIAVWVNMATYDSITLVGRVLSGVFDLGAIFALYLLAVRLYNRKVGLLAAALAAAAVLPIQLSHYFAVDSFATVFVIACFYFLFLAIPIDRPEQKISSANFWYFVFFGISAGMAGACKVNTLPVLGLIFLAALIYFLVTLKKEPVKTTLRTLITGLFLTVFAAFIAFRIFQPYAFTGPYFYDVKINQNWFDIIKEVTGQVAGNSEWPPNHHWTKRPVQYAIENMVLWGLGIPLGLMAWFGWGWAGVRMWKGDWRKHVLPFTWVLVYFGWQNMQFWRYMRYFLPIYPFLILFAAWALIEILSKVKPELGKIHEIGKNLSLQVQQLKINWRGFAAVLLLLAVLLGSYGYAFAFTQIFVRDHTRVQASRWILQNIPGPLNVELQTEETTTNIPVPVYNDHLLSFDSPQIIELKIPENGSVSSITAPQIKRPGGNLKVLITRDEAGEDILTQGNLITDDADMNKAVSIQVDQLELKPNQYYFLQFQIESDNLVNFSNLHFVDTNDANRFADVSQPISHTGSDKTTATIPFNVISSLTINHLEITDYMQGFQPSGALVKVSILQDRDEEHPLANSEQIIQFVEPDAKVSVEFPIPTTQLNQENSYQLKYELIEGDQIRLLAETYTLETSWDDALPLSVDGVDALGGIYTPLNLELYEPDTPEKRERMIKILDSSEYIVIPSNRAYDAMPRLELRYPLTLKYYQLLFNCQCSGDALEKTAYRLEPPYQSPLGFDLVAVFTSNPTLGWIQINDQNADESFTVYDHPKVFVFKKSADFSIENIKQAFYAVDLDNVVFQVPIDYSRAPTALQLTAERLTAQLNGGTWSEIYNRLSLLNESQPIGVIVWYVLLFVFGLVVFPSVYVVFSGLPDKGYPVIRMAGLLLMAWLPWMFGSLKWLPFTRWSILLCFFILIFFNGWMMLKKKTELITYFKQNWRYIVFIEGLFLGLFLFSLSIRLQNPDLWHPWLGGEKPMEFAFFNSVLKAVYFPPENPWFSGHYINYYYYGYVVAAIPTKLLGIIPSIAFNLVIPSWFAMTGIGVFAVGYNLYEVGKRYSQRTQDKSNTLKTAPLKLKSFALVCGIFALSAVLFFGNFFEVKFLWKYLPDAATPAVLENTTNHLSQVISGAGQVLSGNTNLPGDSGRWYFAASRPILHDGPDTPIVEFPYFTFLYADMHPHLLTMPFFALGFAWCISIIVNPIQKRKRAALILSLIFAAIFIGSFTASHTWDYPLFIGLACLSIFWAVFNKREQSLKDRFRKAILLILGLVVLSYLAYRPFSYWFKTEYNAVELWSGVRTPLADYFVVFGLSLFTMFSLLLINIKSDLKTVLSWLKSPSKKRSLTIGIGLVTLTAMFILWTLDYQVVAFGFPLVLIWFDLIFLKKDFSHLQRLTWLLFAMGYGITFITEILVLKGDVGRSNMVFRIYLEAWFLVGLAMSLALVEIIQTFKNGKRWITIPWVSVLSVLILGALTYPLVATGFKINDRWPGVENPPITLDGDLFMLGDSLQDPTQEGAMYSDEGQNLDLSLDYYAIKFLQDQVSGTPVIVEGHTSEYRWGGRYAIHTGLPTVIGWSWHTRQHNSLLKGEVVEKRIAEVNEFYNTTDIETARTFLKRYRVNLIIVSGLERAYYSAEGLEKFSQMVKNGELTILYGDEMGGSATIYEVTNLD